MKKIVVIIVVLLTLISTYFAFRFLKSEAELAKDPIASVPLDAAVILESSNISKSWFRISETNLVYSSLLSIDEVKRFDQALKSVDSVLSNNPKTSSLLGEKPTVVSLHSGGGGVQFFVSTSCSDKVFEDLKGVLENQYALTRLSENILQMEVGVETYYLSYNSPFVMFSTDANLIKSSVNYQSENKSLLDDSTFVKLRNSVSSNLGLSIYVNGKKLGSMLTPYLKKSALESWGSGKVLPTWMALDVNEKSNTIIINGLSSDDANNKWFTNIIQQPAQNSKSLVLLPTDLLSLKRSSINEAGDFLDNFDSYQLEDMTIKCDCDPKSTFANWITGEVITIQFGNDENMDNAYFIGCEGTPNMVGVLSSFGLSDSLYKQVYGADLYEVEDKSFLTLVGIEDTSSQPLYFSRMHDYAVISTYKGISKLAYQYKASQSSIPNNRFINFAKQLMANYSSVDVYYSWGSLLDNAAQYFKEGYLDKLKEIKENVVDLNGLIWQGSYTKDQFIYHSIAINTNQANEKEGGVVQKLWSFNLQHSVRSIPQVMKNHQTGTNEIVVQDENNNVILLSATGKHKWSKPINEKIIGEIKQIDVYQNGKYQMLFSTATKIHLLDINGNEVTGFPIKLPAQATNEVVVFDYQNDGNYRFLINTIDKKLLNYSKDGKQVEGWVINTTDQIVLEKVERFVIAGLDYIAVHDIGGKIYLYNRKGEPRTEVIAGTINSPEKENIYLQVGTTLGTTKYVYKDSVGSIVEMPLEGGAKSFVLDSAMHSYSHRVVDLENDKLPDFIVSFANKLSVYGPDKQLFFSEIFDFDIYDNFQTIGAPNKYTLIANEKEQLVHLYTYQFKPVPDFPQPGSVKSCMGDLNKDGKMEFITIVDGTEVVCYSIDLLFGI